MTLRVSDWQSESDLDSIRNSFDVLEPHFVKQLTSLWWKSSFQFEQQENKWHFSAASIPRTMLPPNSTQQDTQTTQVRAMTSSNPTDLAKCWRVCLWLTTAVPPQKKLCRTFSTLQSMAPRHKAWLPVGEEHYRSKPASSSWPRRPFLRPLPSWGLERGWPSWTWTWCPSKCPSWRNKSRPLIKSWTFLPEGEEVSIPLAIGQLGNWPVTVGIWRDGNKALLSYYTYYNELVSK